MSKFVFIEQIKNILVDSLKRFVNLTFMEEVSSVSHFFVSGASYWLKTGWHTEKKKKMSPVRFRKKKYVSFRKHYVIILLNLGSCILKKKKVTPGTDVGIWIKLLSYNISDNMY